MDKWLAILLVGCSFAISLFLITLANNPYESYNRAIWDCNNAKDYQSCIVAVNSAYVRMLNKEDVTKPLK